MSAAIEVRPPSDASLGPLDIVAAFEPPPGLIERMEPLVLRSLRSRRAETTRSRWRLASVRAAGTLRHGRNHAHPLEVPTARRAVRAGAGILGILTLSVGLGQAAYAASGAGQPLYGIRVSIERAMLPDVDAEGRVSAQLVLLGRRLDEAEDAAGRADTAALSAAIGTYRSDLDGLGVALEHRPDQSGSAVVGLRAQLERLRQLVDRPGIRARSDVWEAIRKIRNVLRMAAPGPRADLSHVGSPTPELPGGARTPIRDARTAHSTAGVRES